MKLIHSVLGLVLLFGLLGCGQNASVISPVKGEGLLMFDVEASKGKEALNIKLLVTNETDEELALDFTSGQKYELVLKNKAGEEVYRFSEEHMFTMALVHESLAPGETKVYEESIRYADMASEPHTLEASLVVAAINGETIEKNTYSKTIEIQ